MRMVLVVMVVGMMALILPRLDPFGPTAEFAGPLTVVGRSTPIPLHLADRGSGLRVVEARLVPANGEPIVLARKEYPRESWFFGSGVNDTTLTPTVDAVAAQVTEGPIELQVFASDHSWFSALRSAPRLTRSFTIDLTAPMITVLSTQHRVKVGGTEIVVFRAPEAVRSGVQSGQAFFPAANGLFTEPDLHAALFSVPVDEPAAVPEITATDAAGNTATVRLDVKIEPRKFPEKPMPLSDDFLARKVPELLRAAKLPADGDLVAGYLRVNRDGRAASERTVREATTVSNDAPLFQGAFSRLPNGAPLAGYADRRAYSYKDQVIDHQWHMGYDLASLKQSPVPAANAGRVVYVGFNGIYGNMVLIDHGLGVFSLYGHLSSTDVVTGAVVTRNQIIGKTGETGLAGGDHLHFGINLHGVHVDPVEWWDGHWIQDHIDLRLKAFPRAAAAPTPPPAPPAPAAAGTGP